MMTLLGLAGLVIAAVVFLNLLQARDRMERGPLPSFAGAAGLEPGQQKTEENKRLRAAPERRICPVCRTGLTREEYLICAMDVDRGPQQKRQVHIYGCPHCFLTDGVNMARYEKLSDAEMQ